MEQLDDLLTRSLVAIEQAVQEHGGEIVDLTLFLSKLEAWREIALPMAGFLICCAIFYFCLRKKTRELIAEEAAEWVYVLLPIPAIALIVFLSAMSNFYAWAAIFGYPEVYIAYKTLVAAGLM